MVGNDITDETEWEVEAVLSARRARGRRPFQFLVKWTGFEETSWEPAAHLLHAPAIVQQFYVENPQAPPCPERSLLAGART